MVAPRVTAPVSAVVGFAVVPDQPRMFPPIEAIVSQQADPPRAGSVPGGTRADAPSLSPDDRR